MQFVSNYKQLIEQRTIDYMLNNKGVRKPEFPLVDYQMENYLRWTNNGYNMDRIGWNFFTGIDFPWEIQLPFNNVNIRWWFSKLDVGDMFPLHTDTFDTSKTVKRFWMAYTDYQPGHIFTCGNKVLTDYVAGDMFEFTDPDMIHGSCNIGFSPKISLQICIEI